MTDPLRERVLPLLEGVRMSGGSFMARCPAHEDNRASLSVTAGKDQPVVFHCHAGCDPETIIGKLGLTWAELSTPRDERPAKSRDEWTPAGPATAVYDYTDENGTLLFQVLRTADKQFRQRVPDKTAKSGWTWKLGDVRRVLYRLPAVLQAIEAGADIWVCEGEKDVHSLLMKGVAATCNSGGAGKWRPEYDAWLCDANVTVVADRDAPGQAHARAVAAALEGVANSVRIVEAAEGKDITDHLASGHGVEDVTVIWTDQPNARVDLAPDLWEFIATEDDPYDWIVPGLLERMDRLILTGFEGLGKSMLVRQLAVMIAGGIHPFTYVSIPPARVLLIDCENSERQSKRKFRPLAAASITAHHRVPDGGLRIIHRSEGIDLTTDADAAWLLERVTAHQPDILFIGPFYRLHAQNMNDELPARQAVAVLDEARTKARCALVIEAHAGHGEQGRGRSVRPTGSSLLLRWPEFGFGLVPDEDARQGHATRDVAVRSWRGPRDERDWPTHLTWGEQWPWEVRISDADLHAIANGRKGYAS